MFLMTILSGGIINFDQVFLTVTFDLHLENVNFALTFLTIIHRALIFGMCVQYNKTLLIVPQIFDHVTLTYILKTYGFQIKQVCSLW